MVVLAVVMKRAWQHKQREGGEGLGGSVDSEKEEEGVVMLAAARRRAWWQQRQGDEGGC